MLGFSAISETAIADQPGIRLFLSSVSANAVVDSTNPTVNADANVLASELGSVSATTTLGDLVSVTGTANITLQGISATLFLGDVIVWGRIIPAPGTSYTAVTPSSNPTWTEKTTGVSQTYSNISAGSPQSWTEKTTGVSQTWTEVA